MYNNYPSDGSKKICTVTAVDITRKVCKCISDLGELLSDVRWLTPTGGNDGSGSSTNPVENSRVLVDISSGFPFILGSIPNESTDTVRRPNVGRQDIDEPQIADYTTITTGDLIRGPGTPRDQRVGDILNTTDGGAVQGVLSSGTVINKASPLSQIICSRYGDIVRIVSRNYEHFTEVDKEQKVSIRGSLYTKEELYRDPTLSRAETPNVVQYSGNVQAAELIAAVEATGYTYASIPVADFPTIPADDFITNKEYVFNDDVPAEGEPRIPVSTFTRDIEGACVQKIQTTDGLTFSDYSWTNSLEDITFTTVDDVSTQHQDALSVTSDVRKVGDSSISDSSQVATEHRKRVLGGIKTNWWMNETEFQWDVNEGGTFIKGDANGVVINVEGNVVITCSSGGNLTVTNTGNTDITTVGTLEVTAADTIFDLDNCTFNTSGTTTFNSSGNFSVTAPIIALN